MGSTALSSYTSTDYSVTHLKSIIKCHLVSLSITFFRFGSMKSCFPIYILSIDFSVCSCVADFCLHFSSKSIPNREYKNEPAVHLKTPLNLFTQNNSHTIFDTLTWIDIERRNNYDFKKRKFRKSG